MILSLGILKIIKFLTYTLKLKIIHSFLKVASGEKLAPKKIYIMRIIGQEIVNI